MTRKGAEDFSTISVEYTPYYNTSNIVSVRITKSDGEKFRVSLDSIRDIPAPAELGGTIFWGKRLKMVDLPSIAPGDIIEYEVFKKGGNWQGPTGSETVEFKTPYPGYFNVIELFEDYEPIVKKVYVIEENPHKPIKFGIYNGKIEHKVIKENGKILHVFWKENVKGAPSEPFSGSKYDILTKLIVTNIPSWKEMSRYEYEQAKDNVEPDEYVRKVALDLIKGFEDDNRKIEKLFYFVADEIRYLGLKESEREGYEPHPASITLKKRAGDCKDKAALLVALLRAASFKAYYTTTGAGLRVENIPADQTNHAIVAIETEPYKYIYVDPTIGAGGKDLLPSMEALQQVLVAREDGDTLRAIPFIPAEKNRVDIILKEFLTEDILSVKLTIKTTGEYDLNARRYARQEKEKFEKGIKEFLKELHPEAILDSFKMMDPYDYSRYYEYTIFFHIPHPALKIGNMLLLRTPGLNENWQKRYAYELDYVLTSERRYPFKFRHTKYIKIVEELYIEDSYSIVSTPQDLNINLENNKKLWASFSLSFNKDKKHLYASNEIIINTNRITPEEYKKLSRLSSITEKNSGNGSYWRF